MNTKEQIKKKLHPDGYPITYCTGIDDGVDESFKEFTDCVELYKKYRYDAIGFIKEQPELFKKYERFMKETFNIKDEDNIDLSVERMHSMSNNMFQDWLFDYCFGEMIK